MAQLVESACCAGDPGLIPGLRRSPGEGTGYPFQYSWTSLVAQLVKSLPAMQETWVRSLGWEDPPWKRAYSCLENPVDRGAWWATVQGVTKGQTRPSDHSTAHRAFSLMV